MNIKLSLVENLLEAGANIEQQELKGGMRPLHLAVETGDIGVVECLLVMFLLEAKS